VQGIAYYEPGLGIVWEIGAVEKLAVAEWGERSEWEEEAGVDGSKFGVAVSKTIRGPFHTLEPLASGQFNADSSHEPNPER
jgi:hypothetical protein